MLVSALSPHRKLAHVICPCTSQAKAQREQEQLEALRQNERAIFHSMFGKLVKSRNLHGLLQQLGIHVPLVPQPAGGPPRAAPEALKRGLKIAKVTYHPDKMRQDDLTSRVKAEEISKILNAWDISSIK